MREVLIHGMFRSGTTLVSRAISARPGAVVVTDPFVYFFKAYRDFHLGRAGRTNIDPEAPTSDHFLSADHDVHQRILAADLSEAMPRPLLERMVADIRRWKAEQHPLLCARLGGLAPGTFREVFADLMRMCAELYGDSTTEMVGTKLSWCDEFLPALARAFPAMRFVLLVRDLRAVVASQESQHTVGVGRRPLLFYARHWRKSVSFAHAFSQVHPDLRTRSCVVRYEDLVRAPEANLLVISSALGVAFDPGMLDTSAYRSESESGAWTPNTSYVPGSGIYADSVDRWRTRLDARTVRALEALAGPELVHLGYSLLHGSADRPADLIRLGGEPEIGDLTDWMREMECARYLRDSREHQRQLALEELRLGAIEGSVQLDARLTDRMFPGGLGPQTLGQTWKRRDTTSRAAFAAM